MVEAAACGARSEIDVVTRVVTTAEAGPDDVLAADGYVFATPENLAGMAGM